MDRKRGENVLEKIIVLSFLQNKKYKNETRKPKRFPTTAENAHPPSTKLFHSRVVISLLNARV